MASAGYVIGLWPLSGRAFVEAADKWIVPLFGPLVAVGCLWLGLYRGPREIYEVRVVGRGEVHFVSLVGATTVAAADLRAARVEASRNSEPLVFVEHDRGEIQLPYLASKLGFFARRHYGPGTEELLAQLSALNPGFTITRSPLPPRHDGE